MTISRKSWSYKLFNLVSHESPDMSWPSYYSSVTLGLLMLTAVLWAVGWKFLLFVSQKIVLHPEMALPTIQAASILLILVILHMAIRQTRFYKWVINWPTSKIFPPITFID